MQRLLLRLIGFCVRLYYRTNRFGNEVPDEGPVLLVANHPNGLIDPILMGPEHAPWLKGPRCH
jgi:1-acyl-sn-glycerol-3-phosphate acyltransferase